MKITYRREMKHNYMIVDPESLVWRNYECRMLSANMIEGILHFRIRQIDDEIRFYYEITSRQPLGRMLDGRSLQVGELRSLMLGISRVLDRMEQYLLREGSVLLEPDYIYVEPETFRVWLCLIPGLERDFREDYGRLLEYLLGKADHQDKDSVVLAYGLYQETRQDNYGMEDILRLLHAGQGVVDSEETEPGTTDPDEKMSDEWKPELIKTAESKQREFRRHEKSVPTGECPAEKKTKEMPQKEKKEKGGGLWQRLCLWWSGRKKQDEQDMIQVPLEMLFHDESGKEGQTAGAFDKIPYEDIRPGQDTVLLADVSIGNHTALCRLCALDRELEDITISYYPFIIGKQENLVDYLLNHDTVSRLHMRMDRDGDRYFVQDLNSTNGTMVAGRLLENNETVQIHHGDEICIARCRFRFEEH